MTQTCEDGVVISLKSLIHSNLKINILDKKGMDENCGAMSTSENVRN